MTAKYKDVPVEKIQELKTRYYKNMGATQVLFKGQDHARCNVIKIWILNKNLDTFLKMYNFPNPHKHDELYVLRKSKVATWLTIIDYRATENEINEALNVRICDLH